MRLQGEGFLINCRGQSQRLTANYPLTTEFNSVVTPIGAQSYELDLIVLLPKMFDIKGSN